MVFPRSACASQSGPHAARRAAQCRSSARVASFIAQAGGGEPAHPRVLEELVHSATHALRASLRPPIPLEGGFKRAPEHNARGLCALGLPAECPAAVRIIRAMFKCPQQRAKTHAERCGGRREVVLPPPAAAERATRARCSPPRPPPIGGSRRGTLACVAAAKSEEQRPRQSRKAALVTVAADPIAPR
jgi:hypothetical protein